MIQFHDMGKQFDEVEHVGNFKLICLWTLAIGSTVKTQRED